jgi:hypothetical protein
MTTYYRMTKIARSLLNDGVPVLRCCLGLKLPHSSRAGSWDTLHDAERAEGWLRPGDNLAILLGWGKGSPVIVVGLDTYKDRKIIDFARELGVTTKANVWAQHTGRGGYTVVYFYNGPELKRDTLQEGSAIDLLN